MTRRRGASWVDNSTDADWWDREADHAAYERAEQRRFLRGEPDHYRSEHDTEACEVPRCLACAVRKVRR